MADTLYTKEEVKEALGISDLRNLSVGRVGELLSLMPRMDKELRMAVIGEFSNYAEMSKAMISELENLCDTAIKESRGSETEVMDAYKEVLDSLKDAFADDKITTEEKLQIADKMIEVADKMSAKDTEEKQFILDVVRNSSQIITGALLLGASILGVVGVKGGKVKLPKINK